MKYIPEDKLKAEIERLYEIAREASYNGEIEGEMTAYDKILSFITSLQQEQDHFAEASKMGTDDDKIRKAIGAAICGTVAISILEANGTNLSDALFYLEKQKEQKERKWLDGDMKEARENLITCCRDWEKNEPTTLLPIVAERARYFLDHLEELFMPAEWSEEDRHAIENCEYAIKETFKDEQNPHRIGTLSWLKSLRPQPHWKPSEEQMIALGIATNLICDSEIKPLESLYSDLKKLCE